MTEVKEILRVTVGSRAYGTATAGSDTDERVVVLAPTASFFEVDRQGNARIRKNVWQENPHRDLTGWELAEFVKLCLQCNPMTLEVLWVSPFTSTWEGELLRSTRLAFLSRQKVYDAFTGYAKNQRTKMFEQPEVGWTPRNWKFAEAYLRVLYQGFVLLQEGSLPIDLAVEQHDLRDYLMEVKAGRVRAGAVIDMARATEDRMLSALRASRLPDHADLEMINKAVRDMRRLK